MPATHEVPDLRPGPRAGVRLGTGGVFRDALAAGMSQAAPSTDAALVTPRPPPRTYLGFDFGTRRIGVASGNSITGSARALRTLSAEGDAHFTAIGALISEWQPDALVVGVPWHPDGAAHENTRRARRFARQLQGRFRLPVHEVDERYSTVEAQAAGARDLDAAAAALILEQYLRSCG